MRDSDDRIDALGSCFEVILEALRPRCPYCGAKLSHYWFYEQHLGGKQFQICPKCHEKVVKRMDDEKQSCGHCKHFQIDGMFGLWCDIHDRDWVNKEYCSDYEKKVRINDYSKRI